MTDETPATIRSTWDRLPQLLRLGGLASICFLAIAAAVYLLGSVLMRLAPLSLAIAATLFLAALLQPLYVALVRIRFPRGLAALITVIVLLAAVGLPIAFAWTAVTEQFSDLTVRMGEGLARLRDLVTTAGSPISPEQLDQLGASAGNWLTGSNLQSGARTITEAAGAIVLSLVLLFFVFKDGHRMWTWTSGKVSASHRDTFEEAGAQAWQTLTRYARGTAVIALVDAIGIGIALLLLKVPLAFPLMLIVFLGAFVPILGATVAGSIAVLVALAANGPTTALLTLGAVILVQQVEGNLLEPLIMKRQVRLHPVVVLVAVTAGTLAWGIAGAFVAVPMTAVGYRVFEVAASHQRRLKLKTDNGPDDGTVLIRPDADQ